MPNDQLSPRNRHKMKALVKSGYIIPQEIIALRDQIIAAKWSLSLVLPSFVDGVVYLSEKDITQLRVNLNALYAKCIGKEAAR